MLCVLWSPPSSQSQVDGEAVVNSVQHFLKSCQPFFNKLDTVARKTALSPNPLPSDVYKTVLKKKEKLVTSFPCLYGPTCSKALLCWWLQFADVSQQLCDRLKQLLLTCASCKLLSLVDSDPLGYTGPLAPLFYLTYI